jgi:hypothetical protein
MDATSPWEVVVLIRRHCPHTDVVNFFSTSEPFLCIGSVVKTRAPPRYHWRCYLDDSDGSGSAPTLWSAQRRLVRRFRKIQCDNQRAEFVADFASQSPTSRAAAFIAA